MSRAGSRRGKDRRYPMTQITKKRAYGTDGKVSRSRPEDTVEQRGIVLAIQPAGRRGFDTALDPPLSESNGETLMSACGYQRTFKVTHRNVRFESHSGPSSRLPLTSG